MRLLAAIVVANVVATGVMAALLVDVRRNSSTRIDKLERRVTADEADTARMNTVLGERISSVEAAARKSRGGDFAFKVCSELLIMLLPKIDQPDPRDSNPLLAALSDACGYRRR